MKKFLVFVVMLLVVVGVALVVTCPSREAHREAIRRVATAVVNSEMNKNDHDETLAAIGTVVGIGAVEEYLNMNLIVRSYSFYSVGYIVYNNDPRMVSVGLFNHIFTIKEEDAKRMLKSKLSLPNIRMQQEELKKYEGM